MRATRFSEERVAVCSKGTFVQEGSAMLMLEPSRTTRRKSSARDQGTTRSDFAADQRQEYDDVVSSLIRDRLSARPDRFNREVEQENGE